MKRWPHRNHEKAIIERQSTIRGRPTWQEEDECLFDWAVSTEKLKPFQECLTGQMVIPVGIVGPASISFGEYTWHDHVLKETTRYINDDIFIPLAHTEGGLSASMQRGIYALNQAGGITTYLLNDEMTRDSAFLFSNTVEAIDFSRLVTKHENSLREWVNDPFNPLKEKLDKNKTAPLSSHARLLGITTRVVGPVCHVLYRFFTDSATGPNMITRGAYALNAEIAARFPHVYPQKVILEANLGGDKKPSYEYFHGGHGKTVVATAKLSKKIVERIFRISLSDLRDLEWVGLHGAHASGMQSFAFTPASAIAAIFAATGQDLGMVGTSSMAQGTVRVTDAEVVFTIQFGGIEVGTVGGGTSLPHAQGYLRMMGCLGQQGSSQRLAQIVAAAALALEVSASASMASRGSENFFQAHHERGGHRV